MPALYTFGLVRQHPKTSQNLFRFTLYVEVKEKVLQNQMYVNCDLRTKNKKGALLTVRKV
jgi:hypothetical protein